MNKKFKKKKFISIIATSTMILGTVATPVIANPGDYYLQSTHTVYSVEALQADTNSSIKNVLRNALPSDVLIDFGGHLLKYTDANTLISQLLVQHKSLTEIASTLIGPNTASSNVDVSTYIPAAPFVSSISAVNGTITVTLSNVTTVTPVLTDFVIKQSINGATATTVTPTLKMNGTVATFTDDIVAPTAAAQSVVYAVSYKGGASISATAFVVLAGVSANISSATELATALANPSVASITLTASLSASPNITRPLTINLGAYILTGNVSFNYTGTGTSVLTGNTGTRITGSLTVNTPNASFKNGVKVSGTVNIANVQVGTWTESADGNTLTVTDPDGAVITVTGDLSSITVTEGSGGSLTLNINAGGTVNNITSNAPVNIVVATGATVTNITTESGSDGTTITNNGTTGTVTANAPTNIVVAAGATITNITAAAGSGGTTITNNGTTGTVTADVPINLVANVPPTNTVTTGTGSVAVSGTGADSVVVTPAAPVVVPPSGGGTTSATQIVSFAILNNSGAKVGTINGITVDLSAITNNERITALQISASPAASTLELIGLFSPTGAITFSNKTFSLSSPITMTDLLGSAIQGGDVSLGSIRSLFGSTVTFNGTLSSPGYTSSNVSLTLNLGNSNTALNTR